LSPRRHASAAWWLLAGWLSASLPAHAAPKPRGSIVIDGAEPGSEVLLDGAPVGTTPLDPIPALRGDHQVAVRKGPLDFTRTVTVKAGETVVVRVAAKVTPTPSAADEQALELDFDLDPPTAEPLSRRRPKRPEPATPAQAPTPTASTPSAPSPESTLDALPDLDLDFDLPPEPPATAPVATAPALAPAPQLPRATPAAKGPATETTRLLEARREPSAAAPDPFVLPIDEPRAPSRAEGAPPVYRQAWFWAVVGTAAAAAVVVPLLVGASSDPGYVEVRDPAAACPGCGLVLNP
jgi:hypothetical protein